MRGTGDEVRGVGEVIKFEENIAVYPDSLAIKFNLVNNSPKLGDLRVVSNSLLDTLLDFLKNKLDPFHK